MCKMLDIWNKRAWDSDYATSAKPGDNIVEEFAFVIKKYLHEKGDIVDFGCGGGRMMKPLIEMFPKCNIIGVDFSPEMIRRGRADYKYPEKIVLFNALKEELPDCDLLITHSVLRCIPQDEFEKIFDNIVRHSKMMYLIEHDYDTPPPLGDVFFGHDFRKYFKKYKLKYEVPKQHRFLVFNTRRIGE